MSNHSQSFTLLRGAETLLALGMMTPQQVETLDKRVKYVRGPEGPVSPAIYGVCNKETALAKPKARKLLEYIRGKWPL